MQISYETSGFKFHLCRSQQPVSNFLRQKPISGNNVLSISIAYNTGSGNPIQSGTINAGNEVNGVFTGPNADLLIGNFNGTAKITQANSATSDENLAGLFQVLGGRKLDLWRPPKD